MTKKYKDLQSTEEYIVNEPIITYQHQENKMEALSMITQEELDATCITLEESKRRIVERIHRHFHQA